MLPPRFWGKITRMMRYTDSELEALAGELESDLVERKEAWNGEAPEKARQAICGFANDLSDHRKPGVLFIGLRDDGTAAGLGITDELLLTLAAIKNEGKLVPPPTMTVEKRSLRGAEVAVVTVQPADAPPVRYEGRIWIRLGPRRGWATAQDERMLNERRQYHDLPFDARPVHPAPLEALSRLLFEQDYLANAFAPDVLAANERTYAQRLAACKMITRADQPTPTVVGLLVLGNSPRDWLPGAYIQFLRLQGTDWADPVTDEAVIEGALGQLLRRIDEKLQSHNRQAVDLTSAATESRSQPYPLAALQQLVRNAVMHRAYEGIHAPVRVYWFSDRVEIHSPGGPFGAVTAENFGQPGVTDYRNPNLAEALKVLGFVQRFGVGIATARAELRRNGNPPPVFQVQASGVTAIVHQRS